MLSPLRFEFRGIKKMGPMVPIQYLANDEGDYIVDMAEPLSYVGDGTKVRVTVIVEQADEPPLKILALTEESYIYLTELCKNTTVECERCSSEMEVVPCNRCPVKERCEEMKVIQIVDRGPFQKERVMKMSNTPCILLDKEIEDMESESWADFAR